MLCAHRHAEAHRQPARVNRVKRDPLCLQHVVNRLHGCCRRGISRIEAQIQIRPAREPQQVLPARHLRQIRRHLDQSVVITGHPGPRPPRIRNRLPDRLHQQVVIRGESLEFQCRVAPPVEYRRRFARRKLRNKVLHLLVQVHLVHDPDRRCIDQDHVHHRWWMSQVRVAEDPRCIHRR